MRSHLALAGASALLLEGSIEQHHRLALISGSALQLGGRVVVAGSLTLTGASALALEGNKAVGNGNVFGRLALISGSALQIGGRTLARAGGLNLRSSSSLILGGRVERGEEFGFTIFLDIINANLALRHGTRYRARLTADGIEVPISSFNLRAPRDMLGTSLSLTLAKPDPSLINQTANLKFEIGVAFGATYEWVTLLDGGRLAGRDAQIGFAGGRPTDTIQVSALDVLGDRWQLAPARPRTLYNPARVSAEEVGAGAGLVKDDDGASLESFKGFAAAEVLRTESGAPVMPVREAVDNLTFHRALEAAYREGCGFSAVVTNIPDREIERVDFTLEGGYDAGVRPLVALYEPLYHVGDGDVLWITDPDEVSTATLAAARQLPLSAVVTVKNTLPARSLVDAIIVSYREGAEAEIVIGDRAEVETATSGRYGDDSFTSTETRRLIRQFGRASESASVTREVVLETRTSVYNNAGDIIHRETQKDSYDNLNRKSGHLRTVEALLPTIDPGFFFLTNVQEEQCSISYRAHPTRPRAWVQDSCTTQTFGLVLSDNENTYLSKPFRLPILDAHRNGFINPEADQERLSVPLKTIRESLRVRDDGEMDVSIIVIDHIAGVTERSSSTPRVGAIGGDTRRNSSRRVLLTRAGVETVTRRVPALDGGDLPREVVLKLGRRKLNRLNNPPPEVSIRLPGLDFSIRRGSIVAPHDPAGAQGVFIVAGYEISGSALGTPEQYLSMGLDCIQAGNYE